MNIHFPCARMIMDSSVEFGCADVPAVAWCKISSMNVIGCSCIEPCCMPGMSGMFCIESSGFGVGVGLASCWCCAGCAFWPKTVAENKVNKIIKTNKNECFMSTFTDLISLA